MLKRFSVSCFLAVSFCLAGTAAMAQEMVHAVTGTVTAIHPKISMIEVTTDDGSSGHFKLVKAGASVDFDKRVKADATEADKFTTIGSHVIVYYFGDGDVRTAVALRDLGAEPVKSTRGTILKVDRKGHVLMIRDSSGAEQTFAMDPKTIGDTPIGVAEDYKFDFAKGDPVRVSATQTSSGGQSALLIAPVM